MDESTFLKSIGRDPDDDELRLVYADWLEEQVDARAEMVRPTLLHARPEGAASPQTSSSGTGTATP